MKLCVLIGCFLGMRLSVVWAGEEMIDRLDDALTWSAANDRLRVRASGTVELEWYQLDSPEYSLVHTEDDSLLNPRLSLFLDAQAGARWYFFIQTRWDHGFDPAEGAAQFRFDEYALRYTVRDDGRLNFQIGKFATVVGNWTNRHLAWDNPFVTAPLPYESLTGIFDDTAANTTEILLRWANLGPTSGNASSIRPYRVPILWGPSYASGAAVSGKLGRINYAVELKNASLSSRPASWDATRVQWQHPTVSGRLGYRPDESWDFGVSVSTGSYLRSVAEPNLAAGTKLGDYREQVIGQDVGYAWHHLQFWAEAYEARFQIPRVGDADVFAYYLEARYKFTPQFSGALRWNEQRYGRVPDAKGQMVKWGDDVWRIDFAPSYRLTPHSELKVQYSLQGGGTAPRNHSTTLAAQFVLRF